MTFVYLSLAIVFEVTWAIGIKLMSNFKPPIQWRTLIVTLAAYLLSLGFLMLSVRRMNIGTAYAIWAGSGAAIIALIGVLHFHEPRSTFKMISLLLVVAGVVGLNLSDREAAEAPAPESTAARSSESEP